MWKPVIGDSPWYDFIIMFFVNPLAAPVEPIFPYLATSFLGSLIALHMTEPKNSFNRNFVKKIFLMGVFMFIVGFSGVVVLLMNMGDFDAAIDLYKVIYDHRKWTAEHGVPGGWFWQWVALNGVSLMMVMIGIRLAEYRGSSEGFAKYTSFVRRFGFVAFTVYIIQWIYFIAHFIVSSINPSTDGYDRMPWIGTWLVLILTLIIFHFLLKVWSKKGYIGTVEWGIVTIANKLTIVKKQIGNNNGGKWWEKGKLNVVGAFDSPEWQNFPVEDKIKDDLRLLKYLSWGGFVFVPFSIISYCMVRFFENNEFSEDLSKIRLMNFISFGFFIVWFIVLNIFSLNDLGISI